MWTKGNYRRIFLDMHICDDKPEYLSKLDPEYIVNTLKEAGAQMIVVKSRPHTGIALFPTKFGRMHKGLNGRDYVGEMIKLCHDNEIAVQTYFSQMFDNWAYDNHPEWRMINGAGMTSLEETDYYNKSMFRRGRYGLVCPNNIEYREYAKNCLIEMTEKYKFESIFLDMPFWPEVCFCPSCRKRYFDATGKDIPRVVDWGNEEFKNWQTLRDEWMGEFAKFTADCVHSVRPEVTIEQNLSLIAEPWIMATSDSVADASDYAGGDLYGGYLEQSYMCKYFRNITKSFPIEFITSRCEPTLAYHTTTKSEEELLLHTMAALVHDGAISVCDGMNPDGTIVEPVYKHVLKNVFDESSKYEKYVGGELISDVALWYPTHSKCSWSENGNPVVSDAFSHEFLETNLNMARIMREHNILFDVIPSRKLKDTKAKVFIMGNVANVSDEDMGAIEDFLNIGGKVYLSGHVGHERLYELLEATDIGMTEHNVTYMNPTVEGKEIFVGFDDIAPLNIQGRMEQLRFSGEHEVLATITLPYTMTETLDYSAIHSNPPGIRTSVPCVVRKKVGKGEILWTSAPIENAPPYMSRCVVGRMVKEMVEIPSLEIEAPGCVEVIEWVKEGESYLAVMNEQEHSPFIPVNDIFVTVPRKINRAVDVGTGIELQLEKTDNGTKISVSKLQVCNIIKLS